MKAGSAERVVDVEGIFSTGKTGETIASEYLRLRGYRIIERNYRAGHLEIDIIASARGCLAFIEVKTRKGKGFGEAVEAVGRTKIKNMRNAAKYYLFKEECQGGFHDLRFDLVAIDLDPGGEGMTLKHLKGIA